MPQQARVTSIEALDDFRARLIVFVEKASVAVDDVLGDVSRTRLWIEGEQRFHWETQLRRRARELETAEQELFSARLSSLREATTNRQLAVRKAGQALDEAQKKLALLKKWDRHFDSEVMPLAAQVEKFRSLLSADLRQAVAWLGRAVETLDAYSDHLAPVTPTPADPAVGGTAANPPATPAITAAKPPGKMEGSP